MKNPSKKYVLTSITLSVITFLLVFSQGKNTPTQGNPELSASEQSRWNQYLRWIDYSQTVAELDSSAETQDTASFLKKETVLGIPLSMTNDAKLVMKVLGEGWEKHIRLIILKPDDLTRTQEENLIGSNCTGAYRSDTRALIFREEEGMTPFWRGLLLLHEGLHARHFESHKYNPIVSEEVATSEVLTRRLCMRLMEQKGGLLYQEVLNQKIKLLEIVYSRLQRSPAQPIPQLFQVHYDRRLDTALGVTNSNVERLDRMTYLLWHAHFELLKRQCLPEELLAHQVKFVRTRYRAMGLKGY